MTKSSIDKNPLLEPWIQHDDQHHHFHLLRRDVGEQALEPPA